MKNIATNPLLLVANAFTHRHMIFALALREFQSRYAGTLGGIVWSCLHPLAIVSVFYFVFALGFRATGPSGTPFILWFICGLIPWFYVNDTLVAITNSITSNAHLVKKTIFPTEILAFVHIVAGLFSHFIFLGLLIVIAYYFDIEPKAERILVAYYLFCLTTLLLGLGWLFAALQVFFRDIGHALTIVLNLVFWLTPIVWSKEILPTEYLPYLSYNPVYYIVEGYRGLLIYQNTTWPSAEQTIIFWTINFSCMLAGVYVFRRLKNEFADVL